MCQLSGRVVHSIRCTMTSAPSDVDIEDTRTGIRTICGRWAAQLAWHVTPTILDARTYRFGNGRIFVSVTAQELLAIGNPVGTDELWDAVNHVVLFMQQEATVRLIGSARLMKMVDVGVWRRPVGES